MTEDALKLTVYFGESDRVGRHLLSDVLLDVFERHSLRGAVLLRALEGFGLEHALHTQRLLTLSEDLPLVAMAVDRRARIEAALPDVRELVGRGLVTLERTRLLDASIHPAALDLSDDGGTKLTVYLGRNERIAGRRAYLAVVDHLHRHGAAGATVLVGVDGLVHARRERARFFSRNDDVPLLIISLGSGRAIAQALQGMGELLDEPLVTLERAQICKRDGVLLARPRLVPANDAAGLGLWQKLTVYAAESGRHEGHSLSIQLVRRLREAGASGATTLRGSWGFSGDHPPHGDSLLHVRRQVPVVATVVDAPEAVQRWFDIVDDLTDEAGLVTSELVPAFAAATGTRRVGGLRLSQPDG